jgi:hypothetical protein
MAAGEMAAVNVDQPHAEPPRIDVDGDIGRRRRSGGLADAADRR